MITDAELARLISGDMTPADRAEFAERVRAMRDELLPRYRAAERIEAVMSAFEAKRYPNTPANWDALTTAFVNVIERHGVPSECPSHGPETRQRDGRCMRCGVKLK